MIQITPAIRLHTITTDQGTYLNTLLLEHNGNYYHLQGCTKDTIHVFSAGVALYVLTINKDRDYLSLHSYMQPEPDPLNSIYLQNKEIRESLGNKWETMKPLAIVHKLLRQLY